MICFRILLTAAFLLRLTVAEGIAFVSTPYEAVVGQSYNITWGGGDGTAVTLTLREGDPSSLLTVATLANAVTDNYYVWTVADNLQSANDYSLQITQGQSDINYSGLFSISGGSAGSSSSSSNSAVATSSPASVGPSTTDAQISTFSTATLIASSKTSNSISSSVGSNTKISASSSSAATQTASVGVKDNRPSTGVIAGTAVGATIAVILVLALIVFFAWRIRRKRKSTKKTQTAAAEVGKSQLHSEDYKPDRKELEGSRVPRAVREIDGVHEIEHQQSSKRRWEMSANELAASELDTSDKERFQ